MLFAQVRNNRQMAAATGISQQRFQQLLPFFVAAFEERFALTLYNRIAHQPTEAKLPTYEERLFFVLFQLKNDLTYDTLGLVYNMSRSSASYQFEQNCQILQLALRRMNKLPKRDFRDKSEITQFLELNQELWIDATDIDTQRPDNKLVQGERYSGKHHRHTLKSMVIGTPAKVIVYLSKLVAGSIHDYKLLKQTFGGDPACFMHNTVSVDLGYQGMGRDYQVDNLIIPFKRYAKDIESGMWELKTAFNKVVSRYRVRIEHAIGGIKKYRMLAQVSRVKDVRKLDTILSICAGMWNFSLSVSA